MQCRHAYGSPNFQSLHHHVKSTRLIAGAAAHRADAVCLRVSAKWRPGEVPWAGGGTRGRQAAHHELEHERKIRCSGCRPGAGIPPRSKGLPWSHLQAILLACPETEGLRLLWFVTSQCCPGGRAQALSTQVRLHAALALCGGAAHACMQCIIS